MGLLRPPGNLISAMGVLKLSHMDYSGLQPLWLHLWRWGTTACSCEPKPTGQKSSIMRTHKSDGGSQWKDKITMHDHVGQVLAVVGNVLFLHMYPCKTDSYMQIQLRQ